MDYLQLLIALTVLGAPLWRVAHKIGRIEARLEALETKLAP